MEVTLADMGTLDRQWSVDRAIQFPPGSAPLVEYDPEHGWLAACQ